MLEKFSRIRAMCERAENMEYCENPMDASGSNFDDAYSMGVEFGENAALLSILQILDE